MNEPTTITVDISGLNVEFLRDYARRRQLGRLGAGGYRAAPAAPAALPRPPGHRPGLSVRGSRRRAEELRPAPS